MRVVLSIVLILTFTSPAFAEWPLVVLVHGLMSSKEWHTRDRSPITDELIRAGFQVHIADTPVVASIEEQTAHLRREIQENLPKNKDIIFVGHSQGGLVSRLYTHLYPKDEEGRRILNVTSIGTPHRGVGQWIHHQILEYKLWLFGWAMPTFVKQFLSVSNEMNAVYMQSFNERVLNVPSVDYLSVPTVSHRVDHLHPDYALNRYYYHWLEHEDNDGLVSAKSAAWHKVLYRDGSVHSYSEMRGFEKDLIEASHLAQIVDVEQAGRVPSRSIGKSLVLYFKELTETKDCLGFLVSDSDR